MRICLFLHRDPPPLPCPTHAIILPTQLPGSAICSPRHRSGSCSARPHSPLHPQCDLRSLPHPWFCVLSVLSGGLRIDTRGGRGVLRPSPRPLQTILLPPESAKRSRGLGPAPCMHTWPVSPTRLVRHRLRARQITEAAAPASACAPHHSFARDCASRQVGCGRSPRRGGPWSACDARVTSPRQAQRRRPRRGTAERQLL